MTTIHARPTGPVTCKPWCCHGDGHPAELYVEDQYCASEMLTVEFSDPGSFRSRMILSDDIVPQMYRVYATQGRRGCTPRVRDRGRRGRAGHDTRRGTAASRGAAAGHRPGDVMTASGTGQSLTSSPQSTPWSRAFVRRATTRATRTAHR